MKAKRKSENTGQKCVRTSEGVLLSGSLDEVVEELKEGRLQRAEKVREEKKQQKIDMEEQHMPPVYHATKLLIEKYGNIKKELIP